MCAQSSAALPGPLYLSLNQKLPDVRCVASLFLISLDFFLLAALIPRCFLFTHLQSPPPPPLERKTPPWPVCPKGEKWEIPLPQQWLSVSQQGGCLTALGLCLSKQVTGCRGLNSRVCHWFFGLSVCFVLLRGEKTTPVTVCSTWFQGPQPSGDGLLSTAAHLGPRWVPGSWRPLCPTLWF